MASVVWNRLKDRAKSQRPSGDGAMSGYHERLTALGLVLPEPLKLPPGMVLPFPWVNVRGDRAYTRLPSSLCRLPSMDSPTLRADA